MKKLKCISLAIVIACAMTWLQYRPILSILAFVAFAGYLALLILNAFGITASRKKLTRRIPMVVFVAVWGSLLIFNHGHHWTDRLLIKLEAKKYESCRSTGVEFKGNRLSVCATNENWWRFNFTEAVVYDSSGQIMRQHRLHSPDWINAALTLGRPFGSGEFSARRLTGDFYLVTFYYARDDELISECRAIHEQCILFKK